MAGKMPHFLLQKNLIFHCRMPMTRIFCISMKFCNPSFFCGRESKGLHNLSDSYNNSLYKSISDKIDLFGATPHIFRNSYITTLAKTDLDLKMIQRISGHANISTTLSIYTQIREEEIQEAGAKVGKLLGA